MDQTGFFCSSIHERGKETSMHEKKKLACFMRPHELFHASAISESR